MILRRWVPWRSTNRIVLGALSDTSGAPVAGDGAATIGDITASGAGSVGVNGAGAATIGAMEAAGSGALGAAATGSGTATLGSITAAGSGSVSANGTVAATLGALSTAAVGSAAIGGTVAAIKAAVERAGVPGDSVDEVLMGNCLMAGQGQAPARQAMRRAGLPDSTGAVTLTKMCGSGMKAVMLVGVRSRWRACSALTLWLRSCTPERQSTWIASMAGSETSTDESTGVPVRCRMPTTRNGLSACSSSSIWPLPWLSTILSPSL